MKINLQENLPQENGLFHIYNLGIINVPHSIFVSREYLHFLIINLTMMIHVNIHLKPSLKIRNFESIAATSLWKIIVFICSLSTFLHLHILDGRHLLWKFFLDGQRTLTMDYDKSSGFWKLNILPLYSETNILHCCNKKPFPTALIYFSQSEHLSEKFISFSEHLKPHCLRCYTSVQRELNKRKLL